MALRKAARPRSRHHGMSILHNLSIMTTGLLLNGIDQLWR
jgi:hypothetical protein